MSQRNEAKCDLPNYLILGCHREQECHISNRLNDVKWVKKKLNPQIHNEDLSKY